MARRGSLSGESSPRTALLPALEPIPATWHPGRCATGSNEPPSRCMGIPGRRPAEAGPDPGTDWLVDQVGLPPAAAYQRRSSRRTRARRRQAKRRIARPMVLRSRRRKISIVGWFTHSGGSGTPGTRAGCSGGGRPAPAGDGARPAPPVCAGVRAVADALRLGAGRPAAPDGALPVCDDRRPAGPRPVPVPGAAIEAPRGAKPALGRRLPACQSQRFVEATCRGFLAGGTDTAHAGRGSKRR